MSEERRPICKNCEQLKKDLVIHQGALAISAELANALRGLIPHPESLDADKRKKWQAVVDAIFKAAAYADDFNVLAGGGKVERIAPSSTTN